MIENTKTYTGQELDSVFFRPMFCGAGAEELGIRVLYNMPVPTTLNFWKQEAQVLKRFSKGWNGGSPAEKYQKTIELSKVKAEMGYAASDYFGMVYEQIITQGNDAFDNLDGTMLEEAETALFKSAIAESIRATMWIGDTDRTATCNTFDGLLKRVLNDTGTGDNDIHSIDMPDMEDADAAEGLLRDLYLNASPQLKQMKNDNQLVYFVTGDVYENYIDTLSTGNLESVRTTRIHGPEAVAYRGIPVIDMQIDNYLAQAGDLPESWAILTDRRNLALAVNTASYPAAEITLWYNPDEMENRQRAVFLAGSDYLLPELVVAAFESQP